MINLILFLVQNMASDVIYDDTYRHIHPYVVITIELPKSDRF